MARIRKAPPDDGPAPTLWRIGAYIRLSREDGNGVSESVVNQLNIIRDAIPRLFRGEPHVLVDTYIDDGTSGTSDTERADFQRMTEDVCAGRINCVIVKNLSRAFRNSAHQGRFLEEFLPLYNTRFLSLYEPEIDTLLDPEAVHGLEVSITGFMNEQYAYKTSLDVRRTFRYKRENGAFIGAFAPYGYEKSPADKNRLEIDESAARVVRDMFTWFVRDGLSKAGIARRLNALGVPNPTAYKRARGLRYENPQAKDSDGAWNAGTVARMLRDPLYIGTLRQGRQRVISYKVHRRTAVPERDWFVVEHAVPPIVDEALFQAAQDLHRRDTRTPPGSGQLHLFSGLVRCADCGGAMRRTTAKQFAYYVCRTAGCTRHSVREDRLTRQVLAAVRREIAGLGDLDAFAAELASAPAGHSARTRLDDLIAERETALAKAEDLLDGLYLDWKSGDITQAQHQRMTLRVRTRADALQAGLTQLRAEREAAGDADGLHPELAEFLAGKNVRTLSRGLLVTLVEEVRVHENGDLDLVFRFAPGLA